MRCLCLHQLNPSECSRPPRYRRLWRDRVGPAHSRLCSASSRTVCVLFSGWRRLVRRFSAFDAFDVVELFHAEKRVAWMHPVDHGGLMVFRGERERCRRKIEGVNCCWMMIMTTEWIIARVTATNINQRWTIVNENDGGERKGEREREIVNEMK